MSFPVTINASVGGAEQPGKFATFLNGSDRYQIQFVLDLMAGSAVLAAYKSTDGGTTWVAVGSGPTALGVNVPGDSVQYAVVQSGAATLSVIYNDFSAGLTVTSFTMGGSPAWSGVNTPAPVPPGGGASGEGGLQLKQLAAGFRVLDDSIIAVLVGDYVTISTVTHAICAYSIYSIGGDSWTAWADLGYLDYSDIGTWDMVPCGIAVDTAGIATVLMQQIARAGPGPPASRTFLTDDTFVAPEDAPTSAFAQVFGDGGGSGGSESPPNYGSGGGGGEYRGGAVVIAPSGSYPVTVGPGGAVLADGSGSSFLGISAMGGKHGNTDFGGTGVVGGAGGTGGSGGTESNPGGAGGTDDSSGFHAGGGGGGVGGPAGAGGDGGAGGLTPFPFFFNGGDPGAPGDPAFPGFGGGGGNRGGANPPNFGGGGGSPGGGGGGQGDSADLITNQGVGGAGQVTISWISVRNTHACRLFQQAILADNSLGVLTEIPEGAYPSRPKGSVPVPLSFDIAIKGGVVWISFTGASATAGRTNIAVGKGASADPVAFSFQMFSSGNGGDNVDSCPALALGTGVAYCCYLSAPSGGPLTFLYRGDFGSGFSAPATIGSVGLPDIREFGRLQATVLAILPEITFGTPSIATLDLSEPS